MQDGQQQPPRGDRRGGRDGRGPGGPGGPGGGPGGRGGPRGPGGRDGRDGGRGGGRGRDGKGGRGRRDRDGDSGGSTFRVVSELPALEKALSKADYAGQKQPLEGVLKALRPLRLKSIDQLDLGTRGKLITALFRVTRQPKPAGADAPPADAAPAADAAPVGPDPKIQAWRDVMYLVGGIWRAVGDESKAAVAYASSGRPAAEKEAVETLHRTGDWQNEAKVLEQKGQGRDAGRVLERKGQFADAVRLYEEAKDLKSALRAALTGKLTEEAKRLIPLVGPKEAQFQLEKAQAWELLMELHVGQGNFDAVAKLYERARQFDQAGLAWERANKLGPARKAYERAKDMASAERVRTKEVQALIAKGDRLGAAQVLLSAGQRSAAVETLTHLGGPKGFKFLQQLKLDTEALEYAKGELSKATAGGDHFGRAKWLELLGETAQAAEAWVQANRKEKALVLFEQLGDWPRAAALAEELKSLDKAQELFHRAGDKANAERVAALPRTVIAKPAEAPPAEGAAAGEAPGT